MELGLGFGSGEVARSWISRDVVYVALGYLTLTNQVYRLRGVYNEKCR